MSLLHVRLVTKLNSPQLKDLQLLFIFKFCVKLILSEITLIDVCRNVKPFSGLFGIDLSYFGTIKQTAENGIKSQRTLITNTEKRLRENSILLGFKYEKLMNL